MENTFDQGRWLGHFGKSPMRWTALVILLMLLPGSMAFAQTNFRPLERGDYSEVEEQLIVLRGLEAGADYALRVATLDGDDLDYQQKGTRTYQDLRLKLNTVFHRDVSIHLNLELAQGDVSETRLREAETDGRGRLKDSGATIVNAREAYLRYGFNPRSAMLFGKHELSLGDRRGKIYDGISPGVTFDCRMGTWCFPFGLALIGGEAGDAIFHLAFQYTGWENQTESGRDILQVEVYRLVYNEGNVPLGKNLGPGFYNPEDPDTGIEPDHSQLLDGGFPVYYDADDIEYFGFRAVWESQWFFLNFDVTSSQGVRKYHRYRHPEDGISGLLSQGEAQSQQSVKGVAVEYEIGLRFPGVNLGIRFMNATGDEYVDPDSPDVFLRQINGYHEITPGSYKGARLYFNGGDSDVSDGGGLGHSINNTRLIGFFVDFDSKEKLNLSYSLGIYSLTLNDAIENSAGLLTDSIGLEVDNLLIWHVHKAVQFQFEFNAILADGALRYDDYAPPPSNQDDIMQGLWRIVYSF